MTTLILKMYLKKTIFNINKHVFYICGDINIDYLKPQNNHYLTTITSLGCTQTVEVPTRYNKNSNSASIIDHLYTNKPQNSIVTKVITHDITDHLPIFAIIKENKRRQQERSSYTIRDLKNFDKQKYLNDLSNKLSSLTLDVENANDNFTNFNNLLEDTINTHAPLRKLTRKELKLKKKPWITKAILVSTKTKNNLYKNYLKSCNAVSCYLYKNYRNCLTRIKEKSKQMHYCKQVEKSRKNSKMIWKTINDILMHKESNSRSITSITDNCGRNYSDY